MARTKGAKNKVPQTVKENILCVWEMVGGREGMAKWAKQNPDAFYRMYGTMAPKEVIADVDADLTIQLVSYAEANDENEPE